MDLRDYIQGVFQGPEKNKLKAMEKTESAEHNTVISFLHVFATPECSAFMERWPLGAYFLGPGMRELYKSYEHLIKGFIARLLRQGSPECICGKHQE